MTNRRDIMDRDDMVAVKHGTRVRWTPQQFPARARMSQREELFPDVALSSSPPRAAKEAVRDGEVTLNLRRHTLDTGHWPPGIARVDEEFVHACAHSRVTMMAVS